MRFRGMLIAVAVLAALGGLAWWSEKRQKTDEGKPGKDAPQKLVTIPEDQIQQIEVSKQGGETTVVKRVNSKWEITAPKPLPTDQDSTNSLSTAVAGLSAERTVEEKAGDLSSYG